MLRAELSPRRLLTVGVILLIAIFLVMLFKKSDKFLEVPDEAHALSGIVSIPGAKPQHGGGRYLLRRRARPARFTPAGGAAVHASGGLRPDSIGGVRPVRADVRAAAQARGRDDEGLAGKGIGCRSARARLQGARARGGRPRRGRRAEFERARRAASRRTSSWPRTADRSATRPISSACSQATRSGTWSASVCGAESKRLTFRIRTIADDRDPKRAIIGFIPFEEVDVHLPFPVHFNLRENVGGPSAGLAFALEVMEERGRDVDHGLKIAATGEIELDGIGEEHRRRQAEDDRRAKIACRRIPRPGRWGQREGGQALRAWPAHHPCEELSTGVAGAGNTRPKGLASGTFRRFRNCRKMHSFQLRQLLSGAVTFVVSPLVTAALPTPLGRRTFEQADPTDVRRLLLPACRSLRTSHRLAVPDVPPPQPWLARPAASAAPRAAAAALVRLRPALRRQPRDGAHLHGSHPASRS